MSAPGSCFSLFRLLIMTKATASNCREEIAARWPTSTALLAGNMTSMLREGSVGWIMVAVIDSSAFHPLIKAGDACFKFGWRETWVKSGLWSVANLSGVRCYTAPPQEKLQPNILRLVWFEWPGCYKYQISLLRIMFTRSNFMLDLSQAVIHRWQRNWGFYSYPGWHKLSKAAKRLCRIFFICEDFWGLKGWTWGQPQKI